MDRDRGPRLLDPDLAGWRVQRVLDIPEENPISIVPDGCCEIPSASTMSIDRNDKLPRYIREGVPWVWLVDPIARLVEVFEPDAKGRPTLAIAAGDDDRVELPPFEGALDVGAWWVPRREG